jgi:hypothetical protein
MRKERSIKVQKHEPKLIEAKNGDSIIKKYIEV